MPMLSSATKKVGSLLGDDLANAIAPRLGSAAMGAAIGGLGGMATHAATGMLGSIGGIATSPIGSPIYGTGSVGGMIGAGMRGAMVGGAIGASMNTTAAHKVIGSFGMLAPQTASKMSSHLVGSGLNKNTSRIAASLDYGSMMGSNLKLGQRIKEAGSNIYSKGTMESRVGAGAMLGGLAYGAYSANALGMAVPSSYGYR